MISLDDAVRSLRADPSSAQLITDAYLDEDVGEAATRFRRSAEFAQVLQEVGEAARGKVLDLGSGRGIAAHAFAEAGSEMVVALEPDGSSEVGYGAIRRIPPGEKIAIVGGVGEQIPIKDGELDLVYVRQVLHHVRDLDGVLKESARVLRPGGFMMITREHVVDDADQLREFLAAHPMHRLAGGENAFPLADYLDAFRAAGFDNRRTWGPWESVINAFPAVTTSDELEDYAGSVMRRKLGRVGGWASRFRWCRSLAWRYLNRPLPGRLYSFLLEKP